MIKRIIFDIDDTLFVSKLELLDCLQEIKKEENMNFPDEEFLKLWFKFEKEKLFLDKDKMFYYIKEYLKIGNSEYIFNKLFEKFSKKAKLINDNTRNIIMKLKEDYEIYILSNGYLELQLSRLKLANIIDLFDKIYCIDNLGFKPDLETYEKACLPHKLSECIMIGDNIINDVTMPIKYGMKALYFNPCDKESNFKTIKSIDEIEYIIKEEY